ncbi:MAG: ferritin-like domain-containing protein [Promethearchaeota archaeon]
MGKTGRAIVSEVENVDELIADLKSLYADEWIATYYYTVAADIAIGRGAKAVVEEIKRLRDDEREHIDELSERIISLGGEPPRDFQEIYSIANCKKVNLPSNPKDLNGFLKAVAEGESCAIEGYNKMLQKLMIAKDPVTFHIIRHIMQEEIEHEDAMEALMD